MRPKGHWGRSRSSQHSPNQWDAAPKPYPPERCWHPKPHRITRVPALFSSRVSEGPLIIKAFAERWNEVCKRLILTAEQFFSPNSLVTRWFFCLIKDQLWCAFIFYTHLIYACIHVYILSTCCVYIGSIPGPLTVEFLVFPLNAEIQHWYTSEFSYVYHNGPLTVETEGL